MALDEEYHKYLYLSLDTHSPFLNNAINVPLKDVNEALSGLPSLQKDLDNFSRILGKHVASLRKKERQYFLTHLPAINSIEYLFLNESLWKKDKWILEILIISYLFVA